MKLFKKIVDERQEQELMRIERIGFWVMFWGLLIAIHVQLFAYGLSLQQIMGEFIVLLIGALIVSIGCIRKGLWSYVTKPSIQSNSVYSLIGSLTTTSISIALQYKRMSEAENVDLISLLPTFIIQALVMFVICFILLTVSSAITNKRKEQLEANFDGMNK